MKNLINTFLNDEAGASAAEYALILAVIGVGIGLAAGALGDAIQVAIERATGEIEAANTEAAPASA